MARPRARELWEMPEIVEEIMFRVPPDEPECLFRASLVCKLWCRVLSGQAFRRSYRTLHRTPPILGFQNTWWGVNHFVPTTSFRLRNAKRWDTCVLDCRHRRLLVEENQYVRQGDEEDDYVEGGDLNMVVWDPVSGSRTKLPDPDVFDPRVHSSDYSAAVLCAVDGCNHDACNLGPFYVAFICINQDDDAYVDENAKRLVSASIYSSETREWSSPTHIGVGRSGANILRRPSIVTGQALYILLNGGGISTYIVLRYDLVTRSLSHFDLPRSDHQPLLISTEDGGLRVVEQDPWHGVCHVWSMEATRDGLVSWIQLIEVDLKNQMLLPVRDTELSEFPDLVGCVEGTYIIIAVTDLGVFTLDLNSLRSRKLSSKLSSEPYKDTLHVQSFGSLFLYTSFSAIHHSA